jgi:hypothetical protein
MKAIRTLAIASIGFCLMTFTSVSQASELETEFIKCTCKNGQCVADGNGGNKCNSTSNCSDSDGNCYQGPVKPAELE